jgi:hypothetical protein
MRTHRTHETIAPWSTGAPVLDPARLAAVRIEPATRQGRPVLVLDLCLTAGAQLTVIPLVIVEPAAVIERDRDPLIFPHGVPGGDDFAVALSQRIVPHLEHLMLDGAPIAEHVLTLAPAAAFEAARRAGCFGAAPLRDALARLAPYRYARRFARARTVRIDAPDAVGGWALLRDAGNVAVAEARRDGAALAWYGEPPVASGRADVALLGAGGDPGDAACVVQLEPGPGTTTGTTRIDVVEPLPLDAFISFDAADGPVRRWFTVVRAVEPPLRPLPVLHHRAAGGSAGRIAVVLGRGDGLASPGADTDEARALVAALGAEGFEALLATSPDEALGADLVHLIGTRDGRRAKSVVDAARRAGIPVAVHAHDDDPAAGGWWGAEVTRFCFEYGDDERAVGSYLAMLARRAVTVGAARAGVRYAPPGAGASEADAALLEASVVFAATAEEGASIRARTGRRGPVEIVPPLVAGAGPAPLGALTGPDRFALVHGPIGPLGNQLLVARCAADAAIPLVVAGPVADRSYLQRVREFGGPNLIVAAGEPAAEVAGALRRAAAVVVDAAWVAEGGARLAAAALAGALLAVSDRRRYGIPGTEPRRFDPADAKALTRALGEAWDEALRSPRPAPPETLAALDPNAVIRAIVRGYAAAPAAAAT